MKKILNFFNQCDEVWIPQAQVEETVREYGYRGPLKVVENGNDFVDKAGDDVFGYKHKARQRLGWTDSTLSLIFVGQHIREKGIFTIIDTLELLKDKIDFRMNFIGSGYAEAELRKRIEESGLSSRVVVHGTESDRSRLSDFYAASDLFIFPSYYDNAPLVIREAAAFATPTILPAGSTAAEVITDGRNGFLSDFSPECFAKIILQANSNRQMLENVAVGAKYSIVRSWKNVVEEVINHYDEAILRYSGNK